MINTKAALRQKKVCSVDNDYLMGLRDNGTRFYGFPSCIIMDYSYTNHGNTESALRQKIVISIDNNYLMGLRDNDTGFAGVPT